PTVEVSVEFVNHVGLSKAVTMPITIFDPPPPEPSGTITGVVMEGATAQSGIEVVLLDVKNPKAAPKATTKADDAGAYRFEKVPPGDYLIACTNKNTRRTDQKPVTVKADHTEKVDLSLLLP